MIYYTHHIITRRITMKKKIFSIFLCICIICSMFCSAGTEAHAAEDYFTVKVKAGDTVCSICSDNGINFEKNKNLIMALNGMVKEAELNTLAVGDILKLPTKASITSKSIISEDEIKYYVIPYVIQEGDYLSEIYWLWGLKFEKYAEDIKSLNYKDDLDVLWIGSTYLLPTTEANVKTGNYTTVMCHTIVKGETAYDVFTAYGIDYDDEEETLERYNYGRDLTKLSAGDELLIPLL